MDGITGGSLVSAKTLRKRRAVQKIPGPAFLKLRLKAINWDDEAPNHLFIKMNGLESIFPAQIHDK
jgi:hypothetical protein